MEVNLRMEGSRVQGMGVSADLIFLVIYKERQWVWKQTPWESMECGESRMRVDLGPHSSPCLHGINPSTCTTGEKGPSPLKRWGSPCSFLLFPKAGLPPCSLWEKTAPRGPRMPSAGRPPELCTCRHCWVPGFYILPPAGVGSAPQVRITGPEEDGVRVVCMASGWFPKPQVQWRDLRGEKFLAFSEAHTQDAEGLFSV